MKVYIPKGHEEEKKKKPLLRLIKASDGRLQILAVDKNGDLASRLFNGFRWESKTREDLEHNGFDTSWANWDEGGAFESIADGEELEF